MRVGRLKARGAASGALAVAAIGATLLLAGCSNDPLAQQYLSGDNKNYIAGDGTVQEIAPGSRSAAVEFEGTTDSGAAVSEADFKGQVVMLNFWWSNCAPCRVEAPELSTLSTQYLGKGASFLGVNVHDEAATAASFGKKFNLGYPSVIDKDGALQLAFASSIPLNAVPATLVVDKQGRVAARILGPVTDPSTLDTLIRDTVAEA
jgi:thiol-disulfide isomerase/thioredoxin